MESPIGLKDSLNTIQVTFTSAGYSTSNVRSQAVCATTLPTNYNRALRGYWIYDLLDAQVTIIVEVWRNTLR